MPVEPRQLEPTARQNNAASRVCGIRETEKWPGAEPVLAKEYYKQSSCGKKKRWGDACSRRREPGQSCPPQSKNAHALKDAEHGPVFEKWIDSGVYEPQMSFKKR